MGGHSPGEQGHWKFRVNTGFTPPPGSLLLLHGSTPTNPLPHIAFFRKLLLSPVFDQVSWVSLGEGRMSWGFLPLLPKVKTLRKGERAPAEGPLCSSAKRPLFLPLGPYSSKSLNINFLNLFYESHPPISYRFASCPPTPSLPWNTPN